MKNSKIFMGILSGLLALAVQGHGQSLSVFNITVKGTSQTTNASGAIVSTKLTDKTFIADAVAATGDTNGLTLVYVENASTDPGVTGDFFEVVNTFTGNPVYTNLQFMYGGAFPAALINADQDQFVAGAQVVPLPLAGSGDALGGATINARALPKKVVISGTFNYTSLRSPGAGSNDVERVVSGSFNIGKPFATKIK
jgi:hypothetical protein